VASGRLCLAVAIAAAVGLGVVALPTRAFAQAQESIEIGRLELEGAADLLACFRGYLRGARKPGAELRLRACVAQAHGQVTVVTLAAVRKRVRCLTPAIQRVAAALRHAEERGADEALDEARQALATCATEAPRLPLRVGL
jgi:hypothetical protein